VVKRSELLEHVWSQPHVGSNVIDAVIRSIRQKLGPFRASIETVSGHGYRWAGHGMNRAPCERRTRLAWDSNGRGG